MDKQTISSVVIVGGGTAGWFSAAMLVKLLGKSISITLVESEEIGTVGVGEATIPPIINFNNALGIDEATFLKETNGTIKLGIQFENWGKKGDAYMHAFGGLGQGFPFCSFHHFWVRQHLAGKPSSFWDYSLNYQAAAQNKFGKVGPIEGTNIEGIAYAYHFDAALYARLLRRFSEDKGVKRIEGRVERVLQDPENGDITGLSLVDGSTVEADFFIDCTGFRALLIGQTLRSGYEDWSHWLPCDSAIAVQSDKLSELKPYTRSVAHQCGWRWQIPLQSRTGNGIVYSRQSMSDDEAQHQLLNEIEGDALTEPSTIRFRTGRRIQPWHHNCVAIGLSSGFLEPLESTSIHMIQSAVLRLVKHFPHKGIKRAEVEEYNRQTQREYEQVRDFIIMHYHVNSRSDSVFWKWCQRMSIPASLADKIALYKQSGKVFRDQDELFAEVAWQQVLIGQGLVPEDYHPLASTISDEQLAEFLHNVTTIIQSVVSRMDTHEQFLARLK